MNQLELLWKLEKSKTLLEEIIKEYNALNRDEKIEYLESQIKNLKTNVADLNNSLIKDNELTKDNQSKLKEYIYTLNNMREELYSGLITDLRQLDYLNKEKEKVKESISSVETEILMSMENMEKMELDSFNCEAEILTINLEIDKMKLGKSIILKDLEDKINKYENEYMSIESKIHKNFVNRFETLRSTRIKSVVAVKDNICTGCNMRVPTFLNPVLKAKEKVVYCESCGRILYYIESESRDK